VDLDLDSAVAGLDTSLASGLIPPPTISGSVTEVPVRFRGTDRMTR